MKPAWTPTRLLFLGLAISCLLLRSVAAHAAVLSGTNEGAAQLAMNGQQQLGAIEEAGVRVVRADASWSSGQPSAPTPTGPGYQFAGFDLLVTELASHDMAWLPVLSYSTPWAESVGGDPFSPPASDSAFAAFAQAIAARYGEGGSFWAENPQLPYEPVDTFEVWNEEDSTMFWAGAPDPARYALLYAQTRAEVHAVDPSARVIVGGLLEVPPGAASQYVQAMFRAEPGLRGHVDGFALHPYGLTAAMVLGSVRDFRQTLDTLGEGSAPIDITEFGWASGAGESWRAAQMHQVAMGLANSDCGIAEISPYVWYEAPNPGGDYSLATLRGLLPSGQAWFAGVSAAARAPEKDLCRPLPDRPARASLPSSTKRQRGE